MVKFLDIALIITAVGLILSVILQSKGAGLGGLTGADASSVFTARRGIRARIILGHNRFERCVLCARFRCSNCFALAANRERPTAYACFFVWLQAKRAAGLSSFLFIPLFEP